MQVICKLYIHLSSLYIYSLVALFGLKIGCAGIYSKGLHILLFERVLYIDLDGKSDKGGGFNSVYLSGRYCVFDKLIATFLMRLRTQKGWASN